MSSGAPASTWRAIVVAVAAIAGALVVLAVLSKTAFGWPGDADATFAPGGAPYVLRIASVAPHGPAERAGLREGDRIDLRALSFDDRALLVAAPVAGHPIAIAYTRGGAVRHTTIVPKRATFGWSRWIAYLVLGWIAAFAAVIGWRRPAMPEARVLSLAMSCYVGADVLQYLVTPSPALNVALTALESGGILGALAVVLFVRFTELFGCPLPRTRRAIDALAYAASGVLAVYGVAGAVALATAAIDPVPFFLGVGAAALVCGVQVLVLLVGCAAIAACRGGERQRVAWAVASIGVLYAASITQIALDTAVPTDDMAVATQAAVNVVAIFAPVGLTYAILRRRLLDIGFALNRAAVFSAVSIIVVGAFMAIEWALGNWLSSLTRITSTLVGLGLAIALGFSIRFVHQRVEHAVDRVFFRRRYEQEKALLRFAGEAHYVTDAETLLRRTVAEIMRHSSASSVAIFRPARGAFVAVCASGSLPAPVDENDAVLVAMRAAKAPVDLHAHASALAGEYAFPMVARGALIGVLVCGPKHGADPYAPDETETLGAVAQAVGVALDALQRGQPEPSETLLSLQLEVAALREDVRELLAAMRLPERS